MKTSLVACSAALALALAAAAPVAQAQMSPPKMSTDPASAPAGDYKLDKRHASVTVKVAHMGLSHYTMRFKTIDASYSYDPANPTAAKLQVQIDPRSVDTGDPKFDTEIADQFFDAGKYPTITFVSTSVAPQTGGRGMVMGDLTFHGTTKPVTLDVVYNGGGKGMRGEQRMGFSATTNIKRSDFGASKYVPLVGDDVAVLIETEFTK